MAVVRHVNVEKLHKKWLYVKEKGKYFSSRWEFSMTQP